MREKIEVDDQLLKQAFRYVPLKSASELVEIALRELVEAHRLKGFHQIKAKISFCEDYNYNIK